ncbi:MAG: hypothetical protein ORN23_04610 [Chthoniobacterales bacterium]|jgi:hypothetical protein|nr:hypothetical protein [Chthoniobacterales bacterium]
MITTRPFRIPSIHLLFALLLLITLPAGLRGEGNTPLWSVGETLPMEDEYPNANLSNYQQGQLAEGQQQILQAREDYRKALASNPEQKDLREHYAWFLYANGYHDKECLHLLEQSLPDAADPTRIFNAIVEVRNELRLPATPLRTPPGVLQKKTVAPHHTVIAKASTGKSLKKVEKEEIETVESFRHWIFIPYYDYSFFNDGRQGWQEEDATLIYRVNQRLALGAEIDIMQRPPSGTNTYYSALASYYLWKWLEVHGKISICPDPTFLALQVYTGGFIYQAAPRLGLLLDYQRYNFIQGPLDQINPGIAYNFTDTTSLVLRYVRGWAFNNLEYNYYSAALNLGLPGNRRLSMAFAYGTDPDAQVGANGNNVSSLSPAYTYSLFFTQPITRDLSLFTGVQYIYRLTQNNSPLYQQLTPTLGLSMKF